MHGHMNVKKKYLNIMLLSICGFAENRRKEGLIFLMGVNEITLPLVPRYRMTVEVKQSIVNYVTDRIICRDPFSLSLVERVGIKKGERNGEIRHLSYYRLTKLLLKKPFVIHMTQKRGCSIALEKIAL